MKIGFIGLGRMGASMAERLVQYGHQVFAYDLSEEARQGASERGAHIAESTHSLVERLPAPHIIWIMVPAGKPTDDSIRSLIPFLSGGDIIIDGGNSGYIQEYTILGQYGPGKIKGEVVPGYRDETNVSPVHARLPLLLQSSLLTTGGGQGCRFISVPESGWRSELLRLLFSLSVNKLY